MRKLDDGQHIVVGTPGRVFDMISRKILRPNYIKQFVLDEADEMLSRGFKDQIYDVFRHLNQETQVTRRYHFHVYVHVIVKIGDPAVRHNAR